MTLVFLTMNNFLIKFNLKSAQGAFLTSLIFLSGLIMLSLVSGILFFSFFQSQQSLNARSFTEARLAAESGLADGLIRVINNKNCPDASCSATYQLGVGTATTTVEICKDACSGIGKTSIVSTGLSNNRVYRLEAILSVNAVNGLVQIISKKE